jgi:tyrosinase
MRITSVAVAALVGAGVNAAPLDSRTFSFLETDSLAAEGVFKLGLYTALNGYPDIKKCNLLNVAYRREWYVPGLRPIL